VPADAASAGLVVPPTGPAVVAATGVEAPLPPTPRLLHSLKRLASDAFPSLGMPLRIGGMTLVSRVLQAWAAVTSGQPRRRRGNDDGSGDGDVDFGKDLGVFGNPTM
jgi:hypothetical protein